MSQLDLEGRTELEVLDARVNEQVERSIAILRQFEPPEGYWLAFSGGKDSVVLYRLAEMSGVKFEAHYNLTTVDPPELVRFIWKEYPEVITDRPNRSFYKMIEKKGFPTRIRRYCCEELKERGGQGRIVLTGIRSEESPRRANRGTVEQCNRMPSKSFVHAIKEWTTEEVWYFIRRDGIPYCCLYDEGWRRLGCVPCPFEAKVARAIQRWPRIWANVEKAFIRKWEKSPDAEMHRRWRTPQEAFAWWCSRDQPYPSRLDEEDEGDPQLFGNGME
jgi:phosphoadenosine phosphosulfate reductase